MPKKETFTSRFEETRGGRVPQKSKIWGDFVYGWSLRRMKQICEIAQMVEYAFKQTRIQYLITYNAHLLYHCNVRITVMWCASKEE